MIDGRRWRWVALAWLCASAPAAAAPQIVVSIKPIHALVAAVSDGVTTPTLLMRGAASPHDFALRPSDARRLSQADIVIWIGESLEAPLAKATATIAGDATVVSLMERPEMALLTRRHGGTDPHLWLDPGNAAAIASVVEAALAGLDPDNAAIYAANGARLRDDLARLDAELAASLAPVKQTPFAVFHDAYQYFERHFGLNAVGAVTLDPEQPPGARRLVEIRATIRETGARCVFAEPQFPLDLLSIVIEGTDARVAILDPLGADLPAGAGAYFAIMRGLAAALSECLSP